MDRLLLEWPFLHTVQAYPFHKSIAVLAEQPVLVRFDGLQKSFGGQTVLDGISGEIRQGEVILLRGENGSGKTTLLNILTGCLEPDRGIIEFSPHGGVREEAIHFPRPWHQELNPFQHFTPERVARLGIGRTWQDIRLFPSLDLADNIAAASTDSDESPWAALFRPHHNREISNQNRLTAAKSLATLGLTGREHSFADKVSLGQSKRVALARALQAKARILFLDEPLAGLDADGIRDVIAHLRSLASEHSLTIVIIEHVLNIPRLLDFVTTVWTLKNGTLAESKTEVVKREPASAQTAASIHDLIRHAVGREVPVTKQPMPQEAMLTTYWLSTSEGEPEPRYTLEVSGLVIHRGVRCMFPDGLSLRLPHATVSVLEAPNGWGKSTLALAIAGFISQQSGNLTLDSKAMSSSPWGRVRAGVAICPSTDKLFSNLHPREHYRLAEADDGSVNKLSHRALTGEYSGGQKQSLLLDVFTASPKRVAILDEPLSQLDQTEVTRQVVRVINSASSVLILTPATHLPEQ